MLKIKIPRTTEDNTVSGHQETGENKTKSGAGRAEDNFIRVTSLRDRSLTSPNITAQLNQWREKNLSTSTVRGISESGLYDRIAVNEPLLKKQNNVKRLQCAKAHKDWTIK